MKRIILLLSICFMLHNVLVAQKDYKLIEESSKSKPSWLTEGTSPGAFMIQANGMATMEDAQNAVMTSLLNQIASSVAVVVTGEITTDVSWMTDDEKETFSQNIQSSTITKIAKIPALQGISISKAEVYWELYQHKKTKEKYYDYYILYPFSQFELERLIDAYNANEKSISDKIDNIENQLDEISDISDVLNNINELKLVLRSLDNGDVKYYKSKDVIKKYEKFIDNINVTIVENNKDLVVIQLKYDDRLLKTSSMPKVTGDCARDFQIEHDGNNIKIHQNTFDCYEQDDNYLTVRFDFGNKKIVKRILINL